MTAAVRVDTMRFEAVLAAVPQRHRMTIDGRSVEAADGRTLTRESPAHGRLVSTSAQAGPVEVEAAIAAARRAFDTGPWPRMTAAERARILNRVADLIEAKRDLFATLDVLEAGKPISQARGEIDGAIDIWRYAAALARDVHGESYTTLGEAALGVVVREPIGVVSIITPWNFPFLILAQKLPFAMAAGCTCVVKPSELTSASTLVLGDLLAEAGVPAGVVNILCGLGPEVGAPMTTDPRVDMISFTGSTRVGKAAMAAAAETLKKVSMELGGKNPQIVFPDCDMDAAIDAAVFGAYFNAGECCNAGSRLIVHRAIAEDFVSAVVARAAEVPVGDPLDPVTKVGALISAQHLGKVLSHVAEAQAGGAVVRSGGSRLAGTDGLFLEPTLVDRVRPDMAIAHDEVFGPVVTVLDFSTPEEAVAIANGTSYGLSAGVWSRDFDTCLTVGRAMRAGTVWMNTFMDGFSELPFGGFKQSGLGRELGRHAVTDYTEEKTLHLHCGPRTAWFVPRRAAGHG